ncbi:MAG TPA: peptidoglycan DD-metalloendopeptidase family protein [Bacteroidia bacterium]|nr:peptidoglycan DD-metalloendopeptidase family protein [Bacteroidia bacterium]
MKRLIIILSVTCIFGPLSAGFKVTVPHEAGKAGDGKKDKTKREDSSRVLVSSTSLLDDESELPDTLEITFPSHDLYASWDTETAHPYKFAEAFKADSVEIELTNPGDCGFTLPFQGNLTSLFGWRKYRPHYGTDIDLVTGQEVVACFDGMVRVARYYKGYGNCVIIRHNNGLETVYAHLSKILVESGQKIESGTVLGLGGNTGHSTGSHLHFEIRYLGQAIDAQDVIDFEKASLISNTFVLRKQDVENKYDLRASQSRYRHDLGLAYGSFKDKNGSYKLYRVRKGDNLSRIAKRNRTSVKSICRKNGIKPGTILRPGRKLKI